MITKNMNPDEYLRQHFSPCAGQSGKKENANAYKARKYWFKKGYPTYEEVAEYVGVTERAIQKYVEKYGWHDIQAEYDELVDKEEKREKKKRDRKRKKELHDLEDKTHEVNKIRFTYHANKLKENYIKLTSEDKELSPEEEKEADKEFMKHEKALDNLQDKARTNLGTTNNYQDKYRVEAEADVNVTKFEGFDYFAGLEDEYDIDNPDDEAFNIFDFVIDENEKEDKKRED